MMCQYSRRGQVSSEKHESLQMLERRRMLSDETG